MYEKWREDIKVPHLKAGRNDSVENLRPVTLVAGGLKNTEAVMSEIAENTVEMDKEQGGFTEGTGAVLRVLSSGQLLFTGCLC